jgi:hypothetical protein
MQIARVCLKKGNTRIPIGSNPKTCTTLTILYKLNQTGQFVLLAAYFGFLAAYIVVMILNIEGIEKKPTHVRNYFGFQAH